MGLEIGIAMCHVKLGRDLFLANSVAYMGLLLLKSMHVMPGFDAVNPMVFTIFNAVGVGSIIACVCLIIKTEGILSEWLTVILMGVFVAGWRFLLFL